MVVRPSISRFSAPAGFSLVELLVVISVISIIASIALPNLASITRNTHYAKNERNAQNIASLVSAARAAGATNQWTTVGAAIDDLEATINIPVGAETVSFRMDALSPEDRAGAEEFLDVNPSTAMVYYVGSSGN